MDFSSFFGWLPDFDLCWLWLILGVLIAVGNGRDAA